MDDLKEKNSIKSIKMNNNISINNNHSSRGIIHSFYK